MMEVNIPVAETTVTLLFEKLGGLGGSPKLLNLRGIRELTQKTQKMTQDEIFIHDMVQL